MVRKRAARPCVEKQSHGGEGKVTMTAILNGEAELNGKGNFFSVITIPPGCSVGWHRHEGECEAMLVVAGAGESCDGGLAEAFEPGDVLLVPEGGGHSVRCTGGEAVQLVSLVYYQ